MFVLLFIFWIIFNGAFTLEIALFGLAISGLIYAFMCHFMDYSFEKDLMLFKRLLIFMEYLAILFWEIVKANIDMAKLIVVKQEYELHPIIFKIETKLQSKVCRALLANSITLTPGTISVSLKDDVLVIHAIDESLKVEDRDDFIFELILRKLEGGHLR